MDKVEQVTVGNVITRFIWRDGRICEVEKHFTVFATPKHMAMADDEIDERMEPGVRLLGEDLMRIGKIQIRKWKVEYGTETE